MPLLALAFSGRMTDVNSINEGTGQSRLQIWSESLSVWRQYPIFGLGEGLIADEIGMVTHNSFLHCYAELGVFGGTAFLSCFLAAGLGLWSLRTESSGSKQTDPIAEKKADVSYLSGFIFTALVACAAAMLSISRQFVAPTYLILGLAAATQSLAGRDIAHRRIGNRFLSVMLFASAASLLAFYLIVRIFVRW
jgi:O-antigen ligase